ncbi:hypothetical protein [Nonomuraea longicatena]|uniref:Secreted protein n=1 Tax=Nonomuraea longicatena TaxID=83682 RepID=A0ABN1Q3S3_9ACTN
MRPLRRVAVAVAALGVLLAPFPSAAAQANEPRPQADGPRLQMITPTGPVSSDGSVVSPMGIGNGVWAKFDRLSLFQCPSVQCNAGEVPNGLPRPADDVAAICQLPFKSPRGNNWLLLYNHNPANRHVGFADLGDVVPQAGNFTPPWCD